jgi:hypothetical protein
MKTKLYFTHNDENYFLQIRNAVKQPLSNGENPSSLASSYQMLFVIKECRVTSRPPCISIPILNNESICETSLSLIWNYEYISAVAL